MKHTLLLPMAILLPVIAVSAENTDTCDIASGKKLRLIRTTPEVAAIVNETRPHEAKAIPAPKFAITSDNNNFILTIGGQINVIAGGDIGNNLYNQSGAGISFVTSQIPVPAVKGQKGDFYITPLDGSVDMQVVGFANTPNAVTGYLKVGTNGVNTNVVLQRAYISWRGLTGGMKLTLFQDDYACQPPTIDPEGPSGCISNVAYELSYKSKSYSGFRFALGVDVPTYYTSNGYYRGHDYAEYDNKQVSTTNYDQIIPDIPAWVEYSFSSWNRIRLSGVLRNFRYKDNVAGKDRTLTAWGAMLSGNIQPASKWILYYQAAYGKGIGSYIQDIAGHTYSFIPDDANPGRMSASPMLGANIGVTFNPTSKLQFNAMFSEARIWGVSDYANAGAEADNYKYALYGAVNCFYNINSFLQLGVEYLYGHRQTWNMGGANDSRVQAQLSFTF
ncbi:MAG: hypothetical protein J1F20_04315 [Muribaculaceae bacterium]|nr:hypothetical protein [Muribaculaceae bacterium]